MTFNFTIDDTSPMFDYKPLGEIFVKCDARPCVNKFNLKVTDLGGDCILLSPVSTPSPVTLLQLLVLRIILPIRTIPARLSHFEASVSGWAK